MIDRDALIGNSPGALSPRPGLFPASIQGEGVVLDLVADRYWGLEGPAVTIWQGHGAGLCDAEIADRLTCEHGLSGARAAALIPRQQQAWADAGLWVKATSEVDRDTFPSKPPGTPAARSLDQEPAEARASLRHAWSLVQAARWSYRTLRVEGVSSILQQLGSERLPRSEEADRWQSTQRIVKTFHRFRRLFVRQKDCLTRSLVLARALQLEGVGFDLCFGARKIPFRAHAWVEVDGVSLLDPADELRWFTVIARF